MAVGHMRSTLCNRNYIAALRPYGVEPCREVDCEVVKTALMDFMGRFVNGYRPRINYEPFAKVWQCAGPGMDRGERYTIQLSADEQRQLNEICDLMNRGTASIIRLALYEAVERSVLAAF